MKFKTFFLSAVSGDLADIRKQYGSDPNAFWVAEIANGNAVGTIIGCVGLGALYPPKLSHVPETNICRLRNQDTTTKPDPATAELRRMVVSPFHQRHGVGTLLLTTVIAHARERGLSSILLSTSGYQTAAMQLYEHFGFIEQQRVEVRVRFLFIVSRAYLHFYGLKL
jgi:ribosomal protein S18 acetylase RimI-like enzyme